MQTLHRVDARKIVLIGYSMGGFAALLTTATDPAVYGVASLTGFQFGVLAHLLREDVTSLAMLVEDWRGELSTLHGTTAEQLVQEVLDKGEAWEIEHHGNIWLNVASA